MGLVRIVVQSPGGAPFAGVDVALRQKEHAELGPAAGQGTTDKEGAVRFWVNPGIYRVDLEKLPAGLNLPEYGCTVRMEDFAEGIEQVVGLVKVD